MAETINGRSIAQEINRVVKSKIEEINSVAGKAPKLVSITVGSGEEARIYVNMQKKIAEQVGIEFVSRQFDGNISASQLTEEINILNADNEVTSMILQKPLPECISHSRIISEIMPEKDAEGVHPYNLGKILRREADIVPCTPGAIMKILRMKDVDLYGKEVVIIGHSAIVGKPLSLMMLNETATTTVCHIGTAEKGDLASHARKADILIVAVGSAELVKGDWIKKGAIVIDVGINRVKGKIIGDVDFTAAAERASAITPVPGGVGPVTVSILMRNVLRTYQRKHVKV